MQKNKVEPLCAAIVSTFVALVVFYAPIVAIQALWQAVSAWGDGPFNSSIFLHAFTYSVPALVAATALLGARLLSFRLLSLGRFGVSYLFPAVCLMTASAVSGRYEADEAAIFVLVSLLGFVVIRNLSTRRSNVQPETPVQDAGRRSR